MGKIIHSLAVYAYGLAITLISPFNEKAAKWKTGRKNYWNQLPQLPNQDVVWFHCASLGEFDQGIPVMKAYKEKFPNTFLIVTFFSPSGMEFYQKRQHPANWVGYLPLPTSGNAKKFITYFKPKHVFFVKYEFWDHYLSEAKKQGAKNFCVAANFRENHRFFGNLKAIFSPVLFLFDTIFVQNERSKELLNTINYQNVVVAGDTRIDKVIENKEKIQNDILVEEFLGGQKAIILGSSWPIDENKWKSYIDSNPKEKFIIAPHDISDNHIKSIVSLFPSAQLYTNFSIEIKTNILIVNTIGKLSNIYQYGKLAYVGGGFTGKLHNILEPAVFGYPVIIGPKHIKFPEAQLLINAGIVQKIDKDTDLLPLVQSILENHGSVKKSSEKFFNKHQYASKRILDYIA